MSTFIDGAPPSVAADPGEPEHCEKDDGSEGSTWLREEMARRMAANASSGGRHARRDNGGPIPTTGEAPRHSATPPRPVGGPVLPMRPPRREQGNPEAQRLDPHGSEPLPDPWTGPRRAERDPAATPSGPGRPSLPVSRDPLARHPTAPPRPGIPPLPRPVPFGVGSPSRPAPPSGSAAARLLSPPTEPPRATDPSPVAHPSVLSGGLPTPIQDGPTHDTLPAVVRSPEPGPPTGPVLDEPLDDDLEDDDLIADGMEDEILWSADALPPAEPAAVPQQRQPDEPAVEPPRGARFPRPDDPDAEATAKRVRVVLAERKGVARPVRTVVDIQEGTPVGELLRANLIGSQLRVALRFAAFAALTLGSLPLLFAWLPAIGQIDVLGLRLPWLLLGFLVYPFLLALGWWHTRTAERVEQNFADHVQE